jgi:DNA modification methylase
MHKYWGKKPSRNLCELIQKYTNEGDTVLDPFSGYGVFCCEAFIMNRNVISNDLNPIANFMNIQLLERDINLDLLKRQWAQIRSEFEPFVHSWYEWSLDGRQIQLLSILRNKDDIPIKARYKVDGQRKAEQIDLSGQEVSEFLKHEKSQEINDWYPTIKLIRNSRISAKTGMAVSCLFTKRTLACHARLLSLIEQHSTGKEKDLLKLAFTANLANCSKLVPPIKSRGDMSAGAWMTGFYVGDTYIENNVLHYFDNRLSKLIKGKEDYLQCFDNNKEFNITPLDFNNWFQTFNNDAKQLDIESESIDYVFTDPPYGDAVPYIEQSIIWNSWLQFSPDYENEIVISDSKERSKNTTVFEKEIALAFSEIRRVLKQGKFFSLTYHSLSGLEWKSITNACINNGFELVDYKWLVQKSFTPRQINRLTSVKGDVLVTLKKSKKTADLIPRPDTEISELFEKNITNWLKEKPLETNEIFLRIMQIVFSDRILIGRINLLEILKRNFKLTEDGRWHYHDK